MLRLIALAFAFSIAVPAYCQGVDLSGSRRLEYDLDYRVWKDKSGVFSVVGKYISSDETTVRIKRKDTGAVVGVPIASLSEDDAKVILSIEKYVAARDESKKLERFTKNIEKFATSAEKLKSKLDGLREDSEITTAMKSELNAAAIAEFNKELGRDEICWLFVVKDVLPEDRSSVSLVVESLFNGRVVAVLNRVQYRSEKAKPSSIRKGDLVSVSLSPGSVYEGNSANSPCVVYHRNKPKNVAVFGDDSTRETSIFLKISVGSCELVSEQDLELAAKAKDWFQDTFKYPE